uniref:Phage protein Gp37/Gp68 n=1 Tax=Candidatus Kentrum sp. LFY TaxID=2126342 RepID=A0A450UE99_9GAMM|nr:MAG: Phage protein Gp37/Gp68 [Candidatus Kentron sp. LFY]
MQRDPFREITESEGEIGASRLPRAREKKRMSRIEWLKGGKTWNPVTGCTKTSRGCRNCYAARMSKRLAGRCGYPKDHPFRVTLHPDRVDIPYRWKKTRRVFVCSMGDLFHPDVPFDFIDRIFDTIWHTPRHRYLLLTKRTDRMVEYIQERAYRRTFGWTDYGRGAYYPGQFEHYEDIVMRDMCGYRGDLDENQDWNGCNHPEIAGLPDEYENGCSPYECPIASIASDRESLEKIGVADDYEFEPDGEGGEYAPDCEWMRIHDRPRHAWPGNLCLGFSAEDQETFEDRIGDFRVLRRDLPKETILFMSYEPALGPIDTNPSDLRRWSPLLDAHLFEMGSEVMRRPYLDWVIAGCETGPGARPMDPDWIRSIRDRCREARIPFFLKKLDPKGERMLDGRMWEETPFEKENDTVQETGP